MERKREYWQSIRGICILAVVLIHTSQITIGSFLFSVAVISWILKQSDECTNYEVADKNK